MFIDIEGFEYELLQYLLDTHAEATCAIRVAAIEWHGRMMPKVLRPPGSSSTGASYFRRMCNHRGVVDIRGRRDFSRFDPSPGEAPL